MESLRQDVKLALRLLRKQLAFSVLAIGTLGLGIGASVALFSVLDAAFIRPLPYANPEQLVSINFESTMPGGRVGRVGPSVHDVTDWKQHGGVFSHIGTFHNDFTLPLILDGDEPQRILAQRITKEYLAMYGVTVLAGRNFTDAEYDQGVGDVVIIGYDLWQTRFGGDPGVAGSTIRLNNEPTTIVGVMPQSFYPKTKLWRPFDIARHAFGKQRGSGAGTYGRLRGGMTIPEAEAALTAIAARGAAGRGGQAGAVKLTSLYESATRSNRTTARVIVYGVGLVLLLACVNVAGLLLARGAVRRPEMAVRSSLGAGRWRLVRQLLTESLILAACGTALGVLLAWWWLDVLVANTPMSMPANSPVAINLKALGFATLVAMVTALLVGLVPAWRVSRTSVTETLSRAGRRHGSALSRRGGQMVIGLEVAVAVVLVAGAALMVRSFSRVLAVDLGFEPSQSIAIDVSPALSTYDAHKQYYPALLEKLVAHPAVEHAGAVDSPPLLGGHRFIPGRANGKNHFFTVRSYVGAYLDAAGFTLKEGRFPDALRPAGGLPAAVISETASREVFGGAPAIGQVVEIGKAAYSVVAVSGDVKHDGPLFARPGDEPVIEVFIPALLNPEERPRPLTVIVRHREGMSLPHDFLREAVQSTGQRAVLQTITPGSAWLDDAVVTPRRRTVLLGLLGGLGLVLALVGIFGVTAYAVSRRTQEIGVRMAFGATHRNVVGVMVRDSSWPVFIGVAAGLLASWWATKAISTFLFQTEPRDLMTFAWVAMLLPVAALIAAWIPARRAARVDPIVALRAE
ncbi:MAG: ADOP family duplicated permease [Vicinamibacterales bacterium]